MNQPRSTTLLLALLLMACVERREFQPLPDAGPPPTPSVPTLRLPTNGDYRNPAMPGARRPSFQWNASTWSGTETIRYEVELSTQRDFSSGVMGNSTTGTSYLPTMDLAVSTGRPVGARYFWRVRACVGDDCSAFSDVWYVNVGRVRRDLNGDGFADVAIVAAGNNPPSSSAGRLYVFLGSIDGVAGVPQARIDGADDLWFRRAVSADDFNGDGFADIAALVTRQDLTMPRVLVYFGGDSPSFDATFDRSVAAQGVSAAGDIDGDGFDDLTVSTSSGSGVIYGGKSDMTVVPFATGDGAKLRGAGDVNGDGHADLITVAPNEARIYFGGAGALDASMDGRLRSNVSNDLYGYSSATAGDVNGDGFADVLVGAPADSTVGSHAGRAYVYLGGPGNSFDESADAVLSAPTNYQLGFNVGSIGDINGDGFDDVGVAYSRYDTGDVDSFLRGGMFIYLGGAGSSFDATSDSFLDGVGGGAYFGEHFAGGDVDGDGFDDLLVGSPGFEASGSASSNVGRAYVFLGAAGRGLETLPDSFMDGQAVKDYFGDIIGDGEITPGVVIPR